jgi:hypothetical protein
MQHSDWRAYLQIGENKVCMHYCPKYKKELQCDPPSNYKLDATENKIMERDEVEKKKAEI